MNHPVLGNRVRFLVWWLVWFFIAMSQSLLFYYAFGSFENISLLDGIISLLIFSGISLSLWYPFRFFNTGETRLTILISNLVASGAISVSLWVFMTKLVMSLVLPENNNYQAFWEATLPYRIGTGVFIYGLVILTYYLFESLSNLSEKNAKEARLESLVKETELKMLRSQINPHFLFNSLNSISSLTINDPEKARIMVIKLSEFMRYALSRKDEKFVSLQSELKNLRLYLDIEKVRFGERLATEENIDEDCLNVNIPVMLLQPLYENAVKHGVYESLESIRILTHAKFSDRYLEITISNNYEPGLNTSTGTGTGLLNVKRRMELFYGKHGSLIAKGVNGIYTVKLYIPVDYSENTLNYTE